MNVRRGIKTIIGSFFRKRGQMGAEAATSTFLVSLLFVVALCCCVISWMLWKFPYHLFSDEVYNIVVVNAPDLSLSMSRLRPHATRKQKLTVTPPIYWATGKT